MNDFLDVYTIVFLALAVFVIYRLRSVLGERTGHERPPFNPFERAEPPKAAPGPNGGDNVIPLPTAGRPADAPTPADILAEQLTGIAPPDSPLAASLKALMAADQTFQPKVFVGGARAAYEMIVLAFARGDRKTLKDLLSKEVYDNFEAAIAQREQRGEKVETTFVSLDKADMVEAELRGRSMNVTMRFVSKLISATRDAAGVVIDGSADQIADLVDVWTFSREAGSRDPNWRLVSTESGQ